MTPAEAIGPVIAELAEHAEITPLRLATETGISRTTLQRRLSGDDNITAREIVRLARTLGIKPSALWALADERVQAQSGGDGSSPTA